MNTSLISVNQYLKKEVNDSCDNDHFYDHFLLMCMALTCVGQYGLAEDAAALIVTGGDRQSVQLAALEP